MRKSPLILASLVATVFTATFFSTTLTNARAAVWETTSQWTPEAESQYQMWVTANWNKDYFNQAGPMKGSVMDCADVVYAMRAIFASEHGLPFTMKDPTTREVRIISNDMTRWDAKEPALRVRAFIQYVFGVGSTATLPADTYPTAIGPATLGPGSFILTDKSKHHSWTIQRFSQTGIPYLLFGSRPARTLLYDRNNYPSVGFVFPNGVRPETHAGFRNFRQPADIGKPVSDVPGFSLEQYSFPAATFMRQVQKRMQQTQETPDQRVARMLQEVCKDARERVQIVAQAVKKHQSIGERCMDATEFDDHSTPSRDSRLQDAFKDLAASYKDGVNSGLLTNGVRRQAESVLSGQASAGVANAACPVEIQAGVRLTLGQIYEVSINGKLSSNPHDNLNQRWGQEAWPSAKAKACPVY